MSRQKPALLLLTNVPAVYRIDLYNRLADSSRCRFLAAFTGYNDTATLHCRAPRERMHFDFKVLERRGRAAGAPLKGLGQLLDEFQPDVQVLAGASPAMAQALFLGRRRGVRSFVWWGGTPLSEAPTGRVQQAWRRLVFSGAEGFLAYSEHAAEHLCSAGVSGERILNLGNCTFDTATLIRRLAVPAQPLDKGLRLLAVSQLSARKNLGFLLDIYGHLQQKIPGLSLEIVGDGPERKNLEDRVQQEGLQGIVFHGRVDHDSTLACFRRADLFVHPARMDRWPQVVNECLCAGLPVIASVHSGLSTRLIRPGQNGYLLELDHEAWIECIQALHSDRVMLKDMGQFSLEVLRDYEIDVTQKRLMDFVLGEKSP